MTSPLSSFLTTLYEASEKNQSKKGTLKFFPFLPSDNNLSRCSEGSFNTKECSSNSKEASLNNSKKSDEIIPTAGASSYSVVESEDFAECSLSALKNLLLLPYLSFLR